MARFVLEPDPVQPGRFVMEEDDPTPTAPSEFLPPRQDRVKEARKGANLGQRVANFFTGDNRAQRGVGEIGWQSIPEQREQRFEGRLAPIANALPRAAREFVGGQQKAFTVGLGMFLDPNEESRAAIIKRNVPTSQFRRDEYGNLQVRYTPSTPWAYINRPGASVEDAQTLTNEALKVLGVSKLPIANPTNYTGLGARAGVAAALTGGATAAGQQAAKAVGGSGVNVGDVGLAAITGAGGQAIGDVAVMGYGAAREAIKNNAMRLADYIDAKVAAVRPAQPSGQVSLDPRALAGRVSEGARNVGGWLDDQARAAAQRGNFGDYTDADTFGVPITRGQAQRNAEQIAREQRFSRSGGSQEAREVMDQFKQEQASALRQAGTGLATRGRNAITENAGQAGAMVAQGMEARQAALNELKNQAYDRFGRAGAQEAVNPDLVNGLAAAIDERLWTPANPIVPDDATLSGLQAARRHVARMEETMRTGGADFAVVEEYRKGLNAIWRDTQPGTRDHRAVNSLIRAFDDWLDNYPYTNPQLQEVRGVARGLHAEERALYGRRAQNDAGGQAVERIIDTPDMTGKSVIDTVLGSDIGARQSALGAVRRIKEAVLNTRADGTRGPRPGATRGAQAFNNDRGTIPPELQSLREAAIYRILAPLDRATSEAGQVIVDIPYGTIRTNLMRALADDGGGPVMAELFRPDEIARMRQFVRLIEQITPPAGTVNYSGTAYEGARMMKDGLQRFVEGVLGSGPAVVFNTLWSAPREALQGAAARQALTRQSVAVPMGRSPQGVAALSGYTTLQNQDDAYGP